MKCLCAFGASRDTLDEMYRTAAYYAKETDKTVLINGVSEGERYERIKLIRFTQRNDEIQKTYVHVLENDFVSNSPLHLAAEYDLPHLVRCIGALGAKVEAYNSVGFTPLHVATRLGHIEVIEALHAIGANLEAIEVLPGSFVNIPGKTAVFIAVELKNKRIIQYLRRLGALLYDAGDQEESAPIISAAATITSVADDYLLDFIQCLLRLEDIKGLVNARRDEGKTLLMEAALSGFVPLARKLIKRRDIDLNAVNERRETALHLAVKAPAAGNRRHRPAIIHCLLSDRRVKFDSLDKRGETPFHLVLFESAPTIPALFYLHGIDPEKVFNGSGDSVTKSIKHSIAFFAVYLPKNTRMFLTLFTSMDRTTFMQDALKKRRIPVEIIERLKWFVFHALLDQELFNNVLTNA